MPRQAWSSWWCPQHLPSPPLEERPSPPSLFWGIAEWSCHILHQSLQVKWHEVQSVSAGNNISMFYNEKRDNVPTIVSMAAKRWNCAFLHLLFFIWDYKKIKGRSTTCTARIPWRTFLNAWKEKWRRDNLIICKNLQQKPAEKDRRPMLVQQSGSCLNLTVNRHSNIHTLWMFNYCTLNCFREMEYSLCVRRRMLISE